MYSTRTNFSDIARCWSKTTTECHAGRYAGTILFGLYGALLVMYLPISAERNLERLSRAAAVGPSIRCASSGETAKGKAARSA